MDLFDMSFASFSNNQMCWVLVVIDCFSKFVYLRAFPKKEGINVANALQTIFFEEGPPEILQSDNGNEFKNVHVDEVCAKFKVKQRYGRDYKPNSQGQVGTYSLPLYIRIHVQLL